MQPQIIELRHHTYPEVEAAVFQGAGPRGVILAPGRIFDMKSWYHMAQPLAGQGLWALCLNQSEAWAVIEAMAYLTAQGVEKTALLGGSKGAYAILRALARTDSIAVDRLAVLAPPPGGEPVAAPHIKKLFVCAEHDSLGFESQTKELHEKSSPPKKLKLFPGTAHSQFMFKESYGAELQRLLLDFLIR